MNKIYKSKKGFGLVECVIALLLFSIISASVITIFTSSRNQIKKQNQNNKLDILSSNILSAYEASDNYKDFSRILNSNLDLNIASPPSQEKTVPLGRGSGAGSIPVAVSYNKIVVNNGAADFVDSAGSSVISFNAGYSKNQLSTGDGKDIPSSKYNKVNTTTMKITGKIRKAVDTSESQWNQYEIIMTNNPGEGESKLTFRIKNNVSGNWFSKEVDELSDFETFLLNKGYYLKCVKKGTRQVATGSHQEKVWNVLKWKYEYKTVTDYTKYIDYYFQIYNASKTGNDTNKNSTAVTNSSKQKLYYCISFSSDDKNDVETFGDTILGGVTDGVVNGAGKVENMRLNLAKTTIKSIYSASCPDSPDSMSELLNGSNKFTGYWNFTPWISYRILENSIESDNILLSDETKKEYKNKMDASIYCCERVIKNEYTPKTADYKTIYYALEKDNKIKLINKNGDWIFAFNASGKTNPLKLTDCVLKDIETTISDGSNLYYKKGSMPQRQIKKIVFGTNIATVYETSGKFIRFIYKNKDSEFEADKAAVMTNTGKFKKYFSVSGSTATIKSAYKGDIYFSCDKFDGPYSITTKNENNDPIFESNANNFEIIGAVEDSELSYGVVGQTSAGEVNSTTYYITCGIDNVDRKLIVKVTFTDLAKVKTTTEGVVIEPRIDIWSIDGSKVQNNSDFDTLKSLSSGSFATPLHSYRKG